jgi:hypothetical protein
MKLSSTIQVQEFQITSHSLVVRYERCESNNWINLNTSHAEEKNVKKQLHYLCSYGQKRSYSEWHFVN